MTTRPEQHVDISALQDLKDIMEDEYANLINTFITDSTTKLAELAAVIAKADADGLRKTAHSLKGSSSNICAGALSEQAKQLEFIGKEGSVEGAAALLKQMETEFQAVKTILIKSI